MLCFLTPPRVSHAGYGGTYIRRNTQKWIFKGQPISVLIFIYRLWYISNMQNKKQNENWNAWWDNWVKSGDFAKHRKEMLQREQAKRDSLTEKCCSYCEKILPVRDMSKKQRTRKDGTKYSSYANICKACKAEENKKWRKDNPEKVKEYNSLPSRKASNRVWQSRRKEKKNKNNTPSWLTSKDKKRIADIYLHMRDCRAVTGEEYHVDHIIPLNGDIICGLHVPWNLQVLPADVNMGKTNKWHWGPQDQE